MDEYMGLTLKPFAKGDVAPLAPVMKRSFDEDTRIHLGRETGGPPGYDDGSFLRRWYLNREAVSYAVLRDGVYIGGFSLYIRENNVNYLGNIFLAPACQNQGLGALLWKFIEKTYPGAVKWQTDTPGFSRRNHAFYVNKCGFHIVKITDYKSIEDSSYYMEKVM